MARIRTIKPEFPQSESVGRLSREARLLFILLWTIVDDEGRARAASRMLASLLYPYDTDAPKLMEKWLAELEAENCVRRYTVEGASYLEIPNWLKHQKIDRPSKSRLPQFASPREDSRALDEPSSTDLGPRTCTLDLGPRTDIRAVAVATRPTVDAFEEFWKAYPRRDGANPRAPAEKKFKAAIRSGILPSVIIAAAQRYQAACIEKQQIGTPYVAQAVTWLNQQRWGDYAPATSTTRLEGMSPPTPGLPSDEELRRKYGASNGHGQSAGAGKADEPDVGSEQPDHERKLLGARPDDDSGRISGQCTDDSSRLPRIRSVGEILRQSSALDAVGIESPAVGSDPSDDGPGSVAGVVRH